MSARAPPPPPRNRPRSALTLPAWPLRACRPGPSHRRRPREMAALPDLPHASSAFPDPSSSPTPRPTRFRPLGPRSWPPGTAQGRRGRRRRAGARSRGKGAGAPPGQCSGGPGGGACGACVYPRSLRGPHPCRQERGPGRRKAGGAAGATGAGVVNGCFAGGQ